MDNINNHVAGMIKMISEAIEKNSDKLLKEYNITNGQVRIMAVIMCIHNGECTFKEIESYFSYSSTAISGMIARLEQKGFLESFSCDNDKRVKCVRMKSRGRDIVSAAKKELEKVEQDILIDLNNDERKKFLSLLGRVHKRAQML